MKHTSGGRFVPKQASRGNPGRHHGGLPNAKDLDPPTNKQAKVARVGQKPSKKAW